ncbi:hypothetical protein ACLMJK_009085 [Lecanora helva]
MDGRLWYLRRLNTYKTEKPYHINLPARALGCHWQTNEVSQEQGDIRIEDIRGREEHFSLDTNGFQVLRAAWNGLNHDDPDAVRRGYYHTIECLLEDRLGARFAKAFTHDIRRREASFPALPRGTGRSPQPIQGVHVGMFTGSVMNKPDFTPRWAKEKLRMLFGDEQAQDILRHKWQVLKYIDKAIGEASMWLMTSNSVWRPLFGPLQDWPLALCDYSSIDPWRDLEPSDNIYTHLITETYNVYYHPQHRWYFLGDMQPEELLIFKSYDSSASNGTARGTS